METPTIDIKRIRQISMKAKKAYNAYNKAKEDAVKKAAMLEQEAANEIISKIQENAEFAAKSLLDYYEVMNLHAENFENYTWGNVDKLIGKAKIVADFLKKNNLKPYVRDSTGRLCFDFADKKQLVK
jgi:predicted RNase H-like nuclease